MKLKTVVTGTAILIMAWPALAQVRYSVTDLGTLGGGASHASGINDKGQVVGFVLTLNPSAWHAFLYSGSAMADLGSFPGGDDSTASGINNNGQVVGYTYLAGYGGYFHAFLYSGGAMRDWVLSPAEVTA